MLYQLFSFEHSGEVLHVVYLVEFHLLGFREACIALAKIFAAFRFLPAISLFWQRSTGKPFLRGTAFSSSLWLARALFLRLLPRFSSLLRLQAPCSLSLCFFSAPQEFPARPWKFWPLSALLRARMILFSLRRGPFPPSNSGRSSSGGGLLFLSDLLSSPHSKCRLQGYFPSSFLVECVLLKTLLLEGPCSTVEF